jgi:DNA-binding CsgD family transcriptional regulator
MNLTAQGMTDKQIARKYDVTPEAVQKFRVREEAQMLDREKFLTLQEVADDLGVKRNTLYAACYEKRVPYSRHGRLIGFSPEQIQILRQYFKQDGPATIEQKARALLNSTLGECVRQRTRAGVKKYGQTLDDNHQPDRAKAVHLLQELMDACQYAIWAELPDVAATAGRLANTVQKQFQLTADEIMKGGKQ